MRIRRMCFLKLGAPNPEDLIKITSCPTPSNEASEGNSYEKVIHPIFSFPKNGGRSHEDRRRHISKGQRKEELQ